MVSKPASRVPMSAGSIVQEFQIPLRSEPGHFNFNNVSSRRIQELIIEEADRNGIERPKGYTVSYHYNSNVEGHHFGRSHPMKPWRLTLTKQLVNAYGLHYGMDNYSTRRATKEEMAEFHKEDYLEFLSRITPDNMASMEAEQTKYNFGEDCPVFDGLYDYCSTYCGSTMDAVRKLNSGQSDIAINWSGGLHHAKKAEASGFCYINDIVLAILELLRYHPRVLYIDIDVHHGDGVEQAFASTDRVMTLSYHKYAEDFFPGTGGMQDTGPENPHNPGAHYALNVPLNDGIDDWQYRDLFADITGAVISSYQPTAIVLQCGADSLGGDRLGKFNLNIKAHGDCVSFIKKYNLPLLLLGGGGYTARNVARLWCHETSLCIGANLNDQLPAHIPYMQAFEGVERGNRLLYPELSNIEGKRHPPSNDDAYLERLRQNIHEQLRYLKGAPSVELHYIPPSITGLREDVDQEVRQEIEDLEKTRKERERNLGGRLENRWK